MCVAEHNGIESLEITWNMKMFIRENHKLWSISDKQHNSWKRIEVKWKLFSHVRLFATPWTVACQAPPSMNSSGKDTGVGSLSLLQWIFPSQVLHWGLLHCRQILYQLSYQVSPERGLGRHLIASWRYFRLQGANKML